MNDEAGSSSAAPSSPPPLRPTEATTAPVATNNVTQEAPSFYFSQKPRLADLIAVLDRLIWLEIMVVYLLDNSFFRLLLRGLMQAVYLMPKPKEFPEQNIPQPYVGGIIGTNVLCMIFHLINNPPEAGEATRGYLHGSLMLDFIGQKGPTSKARLLLLDIFTLLLQVWALAVIGEKKEMDKKKPSDESSRSTAPSNQDHDAEERGEVRGTSLGADAIELQDLGESAATIMQQSEESRQYHSFTASDNVASGQAVVGDFFLLDAVRQSYNAFQQRDVEANGQFATISGLRRRLAEGLQSRGAPG